jgi:single-strand DNA-binding protein
MLRRELANSFSTDNTLIVKFVRTICKDRILVLLRGVMLVNKTKVIKKEIKESVGSLNQLSLRARVSAPSTLKELASGDKEIGFGLAISHVDRDGLDTLDIATWSAKSRKRALALKADQWIEINGAIHRRFWQSPTGVASRWQVEALEIFDFSSGLRPERFIRYS